MYIRSSRPYLLHWFPLSPILFHPCSLSTHFPLCSHYNLFCSLCSLLSLVPCQPSLSHVSCLWHTVSCQLFVGQLIPDNFNYIHPCLSHCGDCLAFYEAYVQYCAVIRVVVLYCFVSIITDFHPESGRLFAHCKLSRRHNLKLNCFCFCSSPF